MAPSWGPIPVLARSFGGKRFSRVMLLFALVVLYFYYFKKIFYFGY